MTIGMLNRIIENFHLPPDTEIQTDSGWECDPTEVDMVYYNSKTKVLMLTRRCGNCKAYEEDSDWKLLLKLNHRKEQLG